MVLFITLWFALLSGGQTPQPAAPTDLYYLVFLKPAPDRIRLAPADAERIQAAHMANIIAMGGRGVLVAAGPFDTKPPAISGIFVFKVGSLEEAQRIAAEDPTVVEHRNVVDVVPWRGPRGIGVEYSRIHGEHPETPEGMGIQPLFLMYRGSGPDTAGALRAHASYVDKLRSAGLIGAAGLTERRDDLVSIVVFNRMSEDVAAGLVADDPAVKSGALRAEAHGWYCAQHVLPGEK